MNKLLRLNAKERDAFPHVEAHTPPGSYLGEVVSETRFNNLPQETALEYVKEFLKNRGIRRPIIHEAMIASFDYVGMHTDDLSPKSAATLIIMLKGSGQLSYFKGRDIREQELSEGQAFAFDFWKPHSFIKHKKSKKCIAFLADVCREQLKRL